MIEGSVDTRGMSPPACHLGLLDTRSAKPFEYKLINSKLQVDRKWLFSRTKTLPVLSGSSPIERSRNHYRWYFLTDRDAPFEKSSTDNQKAHRIITQVIVTGTRVLGRAFAEAYKQAAASQYAQQSAKSGSSTANTSASSGLTLDEACKILNVRPPQGGKTDLDMVIERFKTQFDRNDPTNGGSFYLQSKILRARQRIELEVREAQEAAEREAELKEGWKPKLFKD